MIGDIKTDDATPVAMDAVGLRRSRVGKFGATSLEFLADMICILKNRTGHVVVVFVVSEFEQQLQALGESNLSDVIC